jgi:hypothetical protein
MIAILPGGKMISSTINYFPGGKQIDSPPLISAMKHFLGTKPYFESAFAILSEEKNSE